MANRYVLKRLQDLPDGRRNWVIKEEWRYLGKSMRDQPLALIHWDAAAIEKMVEKLNVGDTEVLEVDV